MKNIYFNIKSYKSVQSEHKMQGLDAIKQGCGNRTYVPKKCFSSKTGSFKRNFLYPNLFGKATYKWLHCYNFPKGFKYDNTQQSTKKQRLS